MNYHMASKFRADSPIPWFVGFLVLAGIIGVISGSLFEGALSSLLLVGLLFIAYNIFAD